MIEVRRDSEIQYRRLFESAKDGILILDAPTGMIVDVNPFLAVLLGLARETFLGKRVWELGCFKDIVPNEAKFTELQAKDDVRYEDLLLETAAGRRIDVEFSSNVYQVNQHTMIQCNIRDITARKQTKADLHKQNRALQAISECNHALIRATEEVELMDNVCRIVTEIGGYRLAWVGYAEQDDAKRVRPVAQAGFEKGYLETLQITWADTERGRGPTGTAIRTGQPGLARDILTDPNFAPWRAEALKRGYAASLVLPLKAGGQVFGALNIYAAKPDAFGREETTLLTELADDLAYGIMALRTRTQQAQTAGSLRQSESKIRHLNDVLRSIQTVEQLILQEKDPHKLLEAACQILVHTRGYVMVWVGQPETGSKRVVAVARAGVGADPMEHAPITWDDGPSGRGPSGTAIRERRTVVINNTHTDPNFALWRKPVEAYGAFSVASAPLLAGQHLFGAITVKADRANAFDTEEVELLSSMAKNLAQALKAIADEANLRNSRMELHEREQQYQTMLASAMDGFWILDLHGRILDCNQACCALFGYARDEMLKLSISDVTAQKTWEEHQARIQRIIARGNERFETPQRHRDGRLIDVEVSAHYIPLMGGRIYAFLRDITARKRADENRTQLITAVEQAAETIVITDPTGAIVYTNPAFEKTTGYTQAEVLGQNPRILKSDKQNPEFYHQMWAHLTAGQVWNGRLTNRRKNGTLYEEDATISPVLDGTGKIINYVAVKRDVTHELALEEQNRQAAQMEAVGQLAGGVAHDFNNMLQIILGNVEIILNSLPAGHPIQADLHDIQTAARRSADLTRQLLAFSRRQPIAPVVLDVNATIADNLKMLSRLIGENIQLHFVQQPALGSIFMDSSQLGQILANLAVNARDAITGAGTISVEAINRTLHETDCQDQADFVPPGDYVVLTFRDDGVGMTAKVQEHIFEPFFTTKEPGKGTGLGLASVYGIVKQNKGAITVQSAPGQGTTFTIYLPRSTDAALAATEETEARKPTGTETILLVEDEEAVLKQAQRTLVQQGYKVLTAATPRSALQQCEQTPEPIHLLLTDVIMPEMSGKELAICIQKLRPGIHILYMSGYTADIMEQQGYLSAGMQVLQKPFTTMTIAQYVRAALDTLPTPQT